MKCPACGHWNQASFPRCFRCGHELPPAEAAPPPHTPHSSGKIYIQINEEGVSTSARDHRDVVAEEMQEFAARKARGEIVQQRLRQEGIQQGFASTSRTIQTRSGRAYPHTAQHATFSTDAIPVEGELRPNAIQVETPPTIGFDEFGDYQPQFSPPQPAQRRMRVRRRHLGLHRFGRTLGLIILIAALGFGGWQIYQYQKEKNAVPPLQDRVIITPSIYNDLPAHRIRIPGEEGQLIWIKEIKQNVPVVGGYATAEINDYIWYENQNPLNAAPTQAPADGNAAPQAEKIAEQVTAKAVITPYLTTSPGEQKPMGQITYEVEIPLSPLMLINPSSTRADVSVGMYPVEFEVATGSSVIIKTGEKQDKIDDLSDLANTDNGHITYQANVSPNGDNLITIVVRAPHCRENTITVNLYREKQEIRLDLAADIGYEWRPARVEDKTQPADEKGKHPLVEQKMVIKGTTVSWANIRVLSDHQNLDLTKLPIDGTFSFEAIFDHIGTNTIIIEASAPGHAPSIVKHDVYYVPVADIYTRNVWDMDQMYTNYLNNVNRHVANTQKYQCIGTIIEIKSDKPQLAVMQLDSEYDRTVMIYNYSNDTLEVNKRYKIFGDAYGTYADAPWINGRYTYIQKDK